MTDENKTKIRDAVGLNVAESPTKSPADVRALSSAGIVEGDRVAKRDSPTHVGRVYDLYEQDGVQMAEVLWPVPAGAEYVPVAQLVRHAD